MTDKEFAAAFEELRLPASAFRHADHVRLAWINLRRYADGLRAFAGHLGKPGLYHEAITYAFLIPIGERVADGPAGEEWDRFARRNPDLFAGVKGALGRWYSDERLGSGRARTGFVMPDGVAG